MNKKVPKVNIYEIAKLAHNGVRLRSATPSSRKEVGKLGRKRMEGKLTNHIDELMSKAKAVNDEFLLLEGKREKKV